MCMTIHATHAVGVTLLLSFVPHSELKAFNWDALGGPPPESNEPIAYSTVPTLSPTPRWARRIKEFLKKNRPKHVVEMLFPDNFTELVEEHKQIKRNMTLDPSWAWRRYSELDKLKGTTIDQIPDHLKNFTFPDMGIGTYDCSKTDEKFNEYVERVTLETDYDKLNAKFDPWDVVNNKSIDWGTPTYDDEEFDSFVKKRIGRLLLGLYACMTTGGEVDNVIHEINAITGELVRILLKGKGKNDNVFRHYFLDNIIVETRTLLELKLIPAHFSNLVNFIVEQFKRLHIEDINAVLGHLTNNYVNIFGIIRSLFSIDTPEKNTIVNNFDNMIKPFVETYDHSVGIDNNKDNSNNEKKVLTESKSKVINQVNNVVNIYINNPLLHQLKKKRSILLKTTTYVPHWDMRNEIFPDLKISGVNSYSEPEPWDSFYAKREAAHDRYLKNKMWLPNNNSKSSFIFETWEYENPNKTRKSKAAQQKNIEAMRNKHEELRWQTKQNKSYQDAFQARKKAGQIAKQMIQQKLKQIEKQQKAKQTTQITTETTLGYGLTLQDITNIDSWFRAAKQYYTYMEMKERAERGGITTASLTTTTEKRHFDSSYERYKRRKQRRRQGKVESESSGSSRSCRHCKKHEHGKRRKYFASKKESSEESESERRCSRHQKHKSGASSDSSMRNKHTEELLTTVASTTSTSTKKKKKKKVTKELDYNIPAEDEPSCSISDVPSHELTSYHYFKEFSLLYFMHPNVSFDELLKNISTVNKWKTTWPWTTRKVRITKWRHPNISWPPMSSGGSKSSQDSYEWGSGQSWIRNQRDEMKSVEHFVRDNLFSEINDAFDRLDKMNVTYPPGFNSKDQDLELSENEDKMADFSARYRKDFRKYKAELKEKEREYQRWSLSGGNYSTTTEFDWEIKITKNFTLRSFRKGGHDVVFDISGMTLDPLSLEQIEKNLDADYLWKYGKNRTKTTTKSTSISTKTSTTQLPSKAKKTTYSNPTSNWSTTAKEIDTGSSVGSEGQSISMSKNMNTQERENVIQNIDNDLDDKYERVDHNMYDYNNPLEAHLLDKRDVAAREVKLKPLVNQALNNLVNADDATPTITKKTTPHDTYKCNSLDQVVKNRKSRMQLPKELSRLAPEEAREKKQELQSALIQTDFSRKENSKNDLLKVKINQALNITVKAKDFYLKNQKPRMQLLHELSHMTPEQIREKERRLQQALTDYLEKIPGHQRPVKNKIRNNRRPRRSPERRGYLYNWIYHPARFTKKSSSYEDPLGSTNEREREKAFNETPPLTDSNFNQGAHPNHPIFYLTNEDIENKKYKTYNMSFVEDKLNQYQDEMIEELQLKKDTSELEREWDRKNYAKYIRGRTTPFFNKLEDVLQGHDKRALEAFTYPPNYDFGSVSVRDPKKEPYLAMLKAEYDKEHAKSIEWLNEHIALARAGKLNTAQWRKQAEEEVAALPYDEN